MFLYVEHYFPLHCSGSPVVYICHCGTGLILIHILIEDGQIVFARYVIL